MASQCRSASARRKSSTGAVTAGSAGRSPKCRASTVSGDGRPSTEPSAESGRWPGTFGSSSRSGGPPTGGDCLRGAFAMFAGTASSRSASSIRRWSSAPLGCASSPHGTRLRRALGDTKSTGSSGSPVYCRSRSHASSGSRAPRSRASSRSRATAANGPVAKDRVRASGSCSPSSGSGSASASAEVTARRTSSASIQVTSRSGEPTTRRLTYVPIPMSAKRSTNMVVVSSVTGMSTTPPGPR
ncbi:Uncharacterised protein [Mycobacteroides abscessus subsp. abscessus]|nr:Uncharacterised protein [Mycobacteroides abscessus subsp. abscessus]